MSEDAKALARRPWEEIVNQANLEAIDEIYPADIVWHVPEGDIQGSEQVKHFVGMYLSAFPDINVTVEDVIVEGEKAVTRWTMRGTHQGELMGIAPTGRHIEVEGITIHRIEGGKIVEEWERYDNLSVMHQLGLVAEQ
jgi:steroid delta-isomerase-like uncharacterized protein